MTSAPAPVTRPQRRGVELGLTLAAMALTILAQVLVRQGVVDTLPKGTFTLDWMGLATNAVGLVALYVIAHLAVRRLAPTADPLLLPLVAALNGIGLAVISRIDLAQTARAKLAGTKAPSGYASLQLVWTAVGIAAFIAVLYAVRDHRMLSRYGYTAALVGLVLMMLPALPGIGATINGARLWLRIGPLTFQPSEVSKILLLVFFASYLEGKRDVLARVTSRSVLGIALPRARDLGPVLIAWAASLAVLVVESDLGSSLLFFGIFVVMLYIATERTSWVIIGLTLFLVGAFAAYELFAHVRERVTIWLHAFSYADAQGYQLVQGLFGFASGGLFGTGLGRGSPQVVPFSRTDFIAAAIGEELGLVGLTAVILCYLLLVSRGMRASVGVRDSFGKLLAGGLSFSFAFQVFIVIGGVTRLIPLTGMTLPFLSYGGSSLVTEFVLVALLLRVSEAARRPGPQATPQVAPRPVVAAPPGPDEQETQAVALSGPDAEETQAVRAADPTDQPTEAVRLDPAEQPTEAVRLPGNHSRNPTRDAAGPPTEAIPAVVDEPPIDTPEEDDR
ncbi:MAG TPA: FtsW/RodA/SpoVE family cell cycle protein [Frankiaceae bacterium]